MSTAPPHWPDAVEQALARAPDPENAANLAAALRAALPEDVAARADADPERTASLLQALCGVAPFLARFLQAEPAWLGQLLEDGVAVPRGAGAMQRRLAQRMADGEPGGEGPALRRFKYYELARLTWRDCASDALERTADTLAELSALADVLLERAFEVASSRVAERLGPPRWLLADGDAASLPFAVIALGKLGAEELNYSSDVDLVYVHGSPPGPLASGGELPVPAEYFTRVAQEFGGLVTANDAGGFLYRVDLDLRPSGAQGTLVLSDEALQSYFELWADTWEKATWTKARPVAGDLDFGWRVIRELDPFIYRSARDYGAVRAIKELKRRFAQERGGGDERFDVKLDDGGIRDVEFIAQAMQLLHAARIPQLRARGTQTALENLADVGLLERERSQALIRDYLFLRRVENRLQMHQERQLHRLPGPGPARERLAVAMGLASAAELDEQLAVHRASIHETDAMLSAGEGAKQVLDLFLRGAPRLVAMPGARGMLEDLAHRFSIQIDASSDPERALNNLDRFVQGAGDRPFYYELLLDRPELVPRLAALFASSAYLSTILSSHPTLIEPIFDDPERLLPDRAALEAELQGLIAEVGAERDPVEHHLDALRLFCHRQVVNIGLLDLGELIDADTAQAALTEVAEVALEDAIALARTQLSKPPEGRYLVVAMGKLATRELSYGSDLDVIFLFDTGDAEAEGPALAEAQAGFVRLTQRLISILQTQTRQGRCYEIDARLRPSGNQGTLVTSLPGLRRYHESSAQVWERQALLRSRAVAGDGGLAADFEALRRELLSVPAGDDVAGEIARIRGRMETELARETGSRRDFKTGRGGVLDVETVVQFLQLQHASEHPDLLDVDRTDRKLARLAELGLLGRADADVLLDGWAFLQRLSARLRIVDNRSISDLDAERGDLDGLALRLGYESKGRGGARRALLNDYLRHTEAIRRVYDAFFADAAPAAEGGAEGDSA